MYWVSVLWHEVDTFDSPVLCVVEITDKLKDTIRWSTETLAAKKRERPDAYRDSYWDYSPIFLNEYPEEWEGVVSRLEDEESFFVDELPTNIKELARMDLDYCAIHVNEESVVWDASSSSGHHFESKDLNLVDIGIEI